MQILITVSCLTIILLVIFVIILIKTSKIITNQSKFENKLNIMSVEQNKINNFLIPTYNNSIRIAKKFGVYYQYNKEDYIQHKLNNINNK